MIFRNITLALLVISMLTQLILPSVAMEGGQDELENRIPNAPSTVREQGGRTAAGTLHDTLQNDEILLSQIQGLYSFLQSTLEKDHTALSPLSGLIALKTGILENIRSHGNYGPKNSQFLPHYQITHPRHGHISRENTDSPQDNTTAIIQHLFPSSAGEFSLPGLKSDFFMANRNDLGRILIAFHQVRENNLSYDKAYEVLRDAFEKSLLTPSDKKSLEKEWNMSITSLKDTYARMFAGALTESYKYPDNLIESALLAFLWKSSEKREGLSSLITTLINQLTSSEDMDAKSQERWKADQARMLSETLTKFPEESASQEKYDTLITKYERALKNSKLSLKVMEENQRKLKQLQKQGYESWKAEQYVVWSKAHLELKEGFSIETYMKWTQKLFNIAPVKKEVSFEVLEDLVNNPELFIFNTLIFDETNAKYPEMLGTGTFTFSYETPEGQLIKYNHDIPDCGESLIRNLFNLAASEARLASFNTTYLQKKFPHLSPLFLDFYNNEETGQKTYKDVTKVGMRTRWAKVVSNLNHQRENFGDNFVQYSEGGHCNIAGIGIDNILAVIEKLLKDENITRLRHQHPQDHSVRRTKILNYIFDAFSRDKHFMTWFPEKNEPLLDNTNIVVSINGTHKYFWVNSPGHFQFIDISETTQAKNDWRKYKEVQEFIFNKFQQNLSALSSLKGLISCYVNYNELDPFDKTFLKGGLAEYVFYNFNFSQGLETKIKALNWGVYNVPEIIRDLAPRWIEAIIALNDNTLNNQIYALLAFHSDFFDSNYFILDKFPLTLKNYEAYLENLRDTVKTETIQELKDLLKNFFKSVKAKEIPLNFQENLNKIFSFSSLSSYLKKGFYSKNLDLIKGVVEIIVKTEHKTSILSQSLNYAEVILTGPLHFAIMSKDLDLINYLLMNKEVKNILLSSKNIQDRDGFSPLHCAVSSENLNIVHNLLTADQENTLLSPQGIRMKNGDTILHLATSERKKDIFYYFLRNARIKNILLSPEYIKDRDGNTSLHLAVLGLEKGILDFLLSNEEIKDILLTPENLRNRQGDTPLHLAIKSIRKYRESESFAIIDLLLAHSARKSLLLNKECLLNKDRLSPVNLIFIPFKTASHYEFLDNVSERIDALKILFNSVEDRALLKQPPFFISEYIQQLTNILESVSKNKKFLGFFLENEDILNFNSIYKNLGEKNKTFIKDIRDLCESQKFSVPTSLVEMEKTLEQKRTLFPGGDKKKRNLLGQYL